MDTQSVGGRLSSNRSGAGRRALRLFSLLVCGLGSAQGAFAWATCWCEIATAWSNGTYNTSQLSLTQQVNKSYNGCIDGIFGGGEQCPANRNDCGKRCNQVCDNYRGSQSLATTLCAKPVANGTVLKCYSHVGTQPWETNNTLGTLTNVGAVTKTVCTCPSPWINPQNVVGGPTGPDKNCKIQVCYPIVPGPGTSLPPNGTSTNTSPSWWTWGNGLYETAPVATCVTQQVTPAQCRLQ